jgi:hypothetical protein
MRDLRRNVFVLLFTGVAFFLSSCDDDEDVFPELTEGTYHLRVYNASGILVFERKGGTAVGTGSGATVWMNDPQFQSDTSRFDKFAMFGINTSVKYDQPWNAKSYWPIHLNSTPVIMYQSFYSLSGDWSYEGTDGYVRIVEASDQYLKGSFRIRMRVKDASDIREAIPDFEWTANPRWGEDITVTGFFFSTHY